MGKKYVICRECGARLTDVNARHLNLHGMSTADYREKYPNATFQSDARRAQSLGPNGLPWNYGISGYTTSRRGQRHSAETKQLMSDNHWSKTRPEEFQRWFMKNGPVNPSPQEDTFFEEATKRGMNLKRQHGVGMLRADFKVKYYQVLIEIDGHPISVARDEILEEKGYDVIHFTFVCQQG